MESLPELNEPVFFSLLEMGSGNCKCDIRTELDRIDGSSRRRSSQKESCIETEADCSCRSGAVDFVPAFVCIRGEISCFVFRISFVPDSFAELLIVIRMSSASSLRPPDTISLKGSGSSTTANRATLRYRGET